VFRLASVAGASPRDLAQICNELRDGKINATGSVTLTPSATATVVTDPRVSIETVILLMPLTADAAAAHATTWVSAQDSGTFTLTHASAISADQSFRYAALG